MNWNTIIEWLYLAGVIAGIIGGLAALIRIWPIIAGPIIRSLRWLRRWMRRPIEQEREQFEKQRALRASHQNTTVNGRIVNATGHPVRVKTPDGEAVIPSIDVFDGDLHTAVHVTGRVAGVEVAYLSQAFFGSERSVMNRAVDHLLSICEQKDEPIVVMPAWIHDLLDTDDPRHKHLLQRAGLPAFSREGFLATVLFSRPQGSARTWQTDEERERGAEERRGKRKATQACSPEPRSRARS